jgi:hypothetical protein
MGLPRACSHITRREDTPLKRFLPVPAFRARSAFLQFQTIDNLFAAGGQAAELFGQLNLLRNTGLGRLSLDVPDFHATMPPPPQFSLTFAASHVQNSCC